MDFRFLLLALSFFASISVATASYHPGSYQEKDQEKNADILVQFPNPFEEPKKCFPASRLEVETDSDSDSDSDSSSSSSSNWKVPICDPDNVLDAVIVRGKERKSMHEN